MKDSPKDPLVFLGEPDPKADVPAKYKSFYDKAVPLSKHELRSAIGVLDANVDALRSSVETTKSLPTMVLALTTLAITVASLFSRFFEMVRTDGSTAALMKSIWGEAALGRINQMTDMEAVINEMGTQNQTIMQWSVLICGMAIIGVVVYTFILAYLVNRRRDKLNEYLLCRNAYQQRLDELIESGTAICEGNRRIRTPLRKKLRATGKR